MRPASNSVRKYILSLLSGESTQAPTWCGHLHQHYDKARAQLPPLPPPVKTLYEQATTNLSRFTRSCDCLRRDDSVDEPLAFDEHIPPRTRYSDGIGHLSSHRPDGLLSNNGTLSLLWDEVESTTSLDDVSIDGCDMDGDYDISLNPNNRAPSIISSVLSCHDIPPQVYISGTNNIIEEVNVPTKCIRQQRERRHHPVAVSCSSFTNAIQCGHESFVSDKPSRYALRQSHIQNLIV